jgi:hypothetical protein
MLYKLFEAIRDDPDLDAQEQHMAFLLASYCRGQNTIVYPGIKTLVAKSHWSKPVVVRVLRGLVAKKKLIDLGRTTMRSNDDNNHRQIWDLKPFLAGDKQKEPDQSSEKLISNHQREESCTGPGGEDLHRASGGQVLPPLRYDQTVWEEYDANVRRQRGQVPRRMRTEGKGGEAIGDILERDLQGIFRAGATAPVGTPAGGYRNWTKERLAQEAGNEWNMEENSTGTVGTTTES